MRAYCRIGLAQIVLASILTLLTSPLGAYALSVSETGPAVSDDPNARLDGGSQAGLIGQDSVEEVSPPRSQPNIIVVLTDDQRWDSLPGVAPEYIPQELLPDIGTGLMQNGVLSPKRSLRVPCAAPCVRRSRWRLLCP